MLLKERKLHLVYLAFTCYVGELFHTELNVKPGHTILINCTIFLFSLQNHIYSLGYTKFVLIRTNLNPCKILSSYKEGQSI